MATECLLARIHYDLHNRRSERWVWKNAVNRSDWYEKGQLLALVKIRTPPPLTCGYVPDRRLPVAGGVGWPAVMVRGAVRDWWRSMPVVCWNVCWFDPGLRWWWAGAPDAQVAARLLVVASWWLLVPW